MKQSLFLISICTFLFSINGRSQEAFTVSTFHNISVYWSPAGGDISKQAFIQYKEVGSNLWNDALSMKFNPIANVGLNPITNERYDKADYRGSIVNLLPNTSYDIQVSLEGTATVSTIISTTWTEDFPIGQTIHPGNLTSGYTVTTSGTANGYLLIDGTGSTIDVQNGAANGIKLDGVEYVIIRGYTITNARQNGIRLYNCNNIVIENCDINNWGEEDVAGTGFGKNYQSGIYASTNSAANCVFQRNKIHHPKWDSNSWAELHDPNDGNTYHPSGPQGIGLGICYIGNNVIRYNEIWSDEDHYFNDILGLWENGSYAGFPGADSDIYGNYLANCFDDGIESEGCNTNVRIWNNYIEEVFLGIGNAATSIGPLYVWKNVSGRAFSPPGSLYGNYGGFLKMGFAGSLSWMTGQMYIFNNTILQPENHGTGGIGTSDGSNRYVRHCETRNNIFHVRNATTNSISILPAGYNIDNDFDYDLMNHPFPAGHEGAGISGVPTYSMQAPIFDFASKTGNFTLDTSSLGYDEGVVISNFTDGYIGVAPDMGAHENGTNTIVYGNDADFTFVLTDTDGDGYNGGVDNCPNLSNPTQSDYDGDGIGDACDTPDTKVIVENGILYSTSPEGMLLKGRDNLCYLIYVNTNGTLVTELRPCPN